jgi:hypothetical protein
VACWSAAIDNEENIGVQPLVHNVKLGFAIQALNPTQWKNVN